MEQMKSIPTGYSSTPEIEKEICQAVRDLHFHNKSELIRKGIRIVLDEIKVKQQKAK